MAFYFFAKNTTHNMRTINTIIYGENIMSRVKYYGENVMMAYADSMSKKSVITTMTNAIITLVVVMVVEGLKEL